MTSLYLSAGIVLASAAIDLYVWEVTGRAGAVYAAVGMSALAVYLLFRILRRLI